MSDTASGPAAEQTETPGDNAQGFPGTNTRPVLDGVREAPQEPEPYELGEF